MAENLIELQHSADSCEHSWSEWMKLFEDAPAFRVCEHCGAHQDMSEDEK